MLPEKLLPTRLVLPSERLPVLIEEPRKPSRFRGAYFLYQFTKLILGTFWLWITFRLTPARFADRVRPFLLRLGTVWIKLGQTLAMRSDLLPAEFAAALATLRGTGTGVPFDRVRRAVEQELHRPLEH